MLAFSTLGRVPYEDGHQLLSLTHFTIAWKVTRPWASFSGFWVLKLWDSELEKVLADVDASPMNDVMRVMV